MASTEAAARRRPVTPDGPAGVATPSQRGALRRLSRHRSRIGLHAVLGAALLVFMLPIIWAISASFKGKTELFAPVPGLLPQHPTLANYTYVLARMGTFPLYFFNSVIVTVGSVV